MVSTAAILRDLRNDAHPVPEEKKATSFVTAGLGVRYLSWASNIQDALMMATSERDSPPRHTANIEGQL